MALLMVSATHVFFFSGSYTGVWSLEVKLREALPTGSSPDGHQCMIIPSYKGVRCMWHPMLHEAVV